MDKEDLEYYVNNTSKFDSIDEAFDDYVYDYTIEELIELFNDEMKEKILLESPSYVKNNDVYYFNGEFCDLEDTEINQIINQFEKERKIKWG